MGKLFSCPFSAFAVLFSVPDLIPEDMCAPDELVCFSENRWEHNPFTWQLA